MAKSRVVAAIEANTAAITLSITTADAPESATVTNSEAEIIAPVSHSRIVHLSVTSAKDVSGAVSSALDPRTAVAGKGLLFIQNVPATPFVLPKDFSLRAVVDSGTSDIQWQTFGPGGAS